MSPYTQQFLNAAGYSVGSGETDIRILLAGLVQVAISLVGIIFFVLIIYGGYLWLSAGGNEEQVKKATQILKSAIVGLIIALLSFMIVRAVASLLFQATVPADLF